MSDLQYVIPLGGMFKEMKNVWFPLGGHGNEKDLISLGRGFKEMNNSSFSLGVFKTETRFDFHWGVQVNEKDVISLEEASRKCKIFDFPWGGGLQGNQQELISLGGGVKATKQI